MTCQTDNCSTNANTSALWLHTQWHSFDLVIAWAEEVQSVIFDSWDLLGPIPSSLVNTGGYKHNPLDTALLDSMVLKRTSEDY